MTTPALSALRPLALGHDQEASHCPWAQLTRRTAEYPSRRAQLALSVMAGALPPTPDVVALLYRCDDCGQCRAHAMLPEPLALERALWPVRAWLVAHGAVPEIAPLRAALSEHGHIYGDLRSAWDRLGPGGQNTTTLFVPDGAVLAHHPEAAHAALQAARVVYGPVAVSPAVPDSGRVLTELGLAAEAGLFQAAVRQQIVDAGIQRVVAGTPKEAVALAELLAGQHVTVTYVGTALAEAALAGRVRLLDGDGQRLVLHASAALLNTPDDYELIEQWLGSWLGDRFSRTAAVDGLAWPAAVERPTIGLSLALAERLAARSLENWMAMEPDLILTCDPHAWRALRAVAPSSVQVQDWLTYTAARWVEA